MAMCCLMVATYYTFYHPLRNFGVGNLLPTPNLLKVSTIDGVTMWKLIRIIVYFYLEILAVFHDGNLTYLLNLPQLQIQNLFYSHSRTLGTVSFF